MKKERYTFALSQILPRWFQLCMFVIILRACTISPLLGQMVVGTITRPGLAPSGLAVYETGNKLCVFDDRTNHLLMYDGETLALKKEIVFSQPIFDPFSCSGMAIDEARGMLFICIGIEGMYPDRVRIATVDLIADSVTAEISVPGLLPQSANGIAYDPGIRKIFIFEWPSGVYIVSLDSNTVTKIDLPGDGAHVDMTLNPLTHEVFLANTHASKLRIINGITHALIEEDAPMALAMTLNWRENKVYFFTTANYPNGITFWIIDRTAGAQKILPPPNDGWSLRFNSGSNTVYTGSELSCQTAIFDGGTDEYFNLPMEGGDPKIGFRFATGHTYFFGNDFVGVFDETTQMFEKIDYDHPHVALNNGTRYMAINQTSGRVFVTSVSLYDPPDENPIWVLQDTDRMISPNVLLGGSGKIGVLDPRNYNTVDYWGLGDFGTNNAQGIMYRPSGGRVYVASSNTTLGTLSVHAGSGAWDKYGTSAGNFNARVGSFDMVGHNPITPVFSPDDGSLYVTCSATNLVRIIDATIDSTLTVVKDISVGTTPWGAVLTPTGDKLYVANNGSSNVSVISTVSKTVVDTIPVGASPWGAAINASGTKVYVANSGSGTVSVINTEADTVIATIAVGMTPHWLSCTPDGKHVFVSNWGDGTVSVIDAGTDVVSNTVSVGINPEGLAAKPDGSRMHVVNSNPSGSSSLSVINTSNLSVSTMALESMLTESRSIAIADPTSKFAGRVTADGVSAQGVLVRALQTGVEKGRAVSNAAGDYCIFNLNSGVYDIEATAPNNPTQLVTGRSVGIGRTTIIHFSVKPNIPAAPSLLAPPDMATGIALPPMMKWNASAEARSYRLQVALSDTFAPTIVDLDTIKDVSTSVTGIQGNTRHFWRVNATNSAGTSAWSDVWSFTTALNPPLAPTLISPFDNATGIARDTNCTWNAIAGATSYRLQISRSQSFSSLFIDSSVSSTFMNVAGLMADTKYYWRVNATNSSGTSNWSNVWSFTTIMMKPTTPTLLTPTENATNVPLNPILAWNAAIGADSYRLHVATNPTFTSMIVDTSVITTSFQLYGMMSNGTYYWRVSATNSGGTSDWSSVWVFVTTLVSVKYPMVAEAFTLEQSYPNPFNERTTITYDLSATSAIVLKIFNALGREIATLVNEVQPSGRHVFEWIPSDLPSGVYYCWLFTQDASTRFLPRAEIIQLVLLCN